MLPLPATELAAARTDLAEKDSRLQQLQKQVAQLQNGQVRSLGVPPPRFTPSPPPYPLPTTHGRIAQLPSQRALQGDAGAMSPLVRKQLPRQAC